MPGAHAPNCPVTDCGQVEWNSRRQKARCTFTLRRKGGVVYRIVEWKSERNRMRDHVNSDCTHCLETVVEPPPTVGFGLCSAAIHDVSYDFIFTALELSALKLWVGQACQCI